MKPASLPLPSVVTELIEIVGHDRAMRLVGEFGGWRLYVPTELRDDDTLIPLLGLEAAQDLVARFGGDTLWLPRCVEASREARNAEILRRVAAGESTPAVARAYSLTARHVARIVKKAQQRMARDRRPPCNDK